MSILKDLDELVDQDGVPVMKIYEDKNGTIRYTKNYVKYLGGLKN